VALSLSKRVRNVARFRDIMSVLASHGFDQLVDQLDLEERAVISSMIKPRAGGEKSRWQRIAQAMEELGPTFIKLGQVLSTRPELLPEEFIVELKKLQSGVSPAPWADVKQQLEGAFGDEIGNVFASFDVEPLAAASVAQVYRARTHEGREIVLKVLRPGIREIVENDIDILQILAGFAERIPELRAVQPRGMVREFERAMSRELDLTHELSNLRRFRENFRGSEYVRVPEPIEDFCSRNVLAMEFLDGVPFNEYKKVGADRETIAKRGVSAVFKMAFDDGFFHADPHPGNVLALRGNCIGLLDVGLAGRLDRSLRDKVIALLSALVRDDPERISEAVFSLGETTTHVEFTAFQKDVFELYEDELRGKTLKDVHLGRLIAGLFGCAAKHNMQVPADLTLMFKGLVTMEGVAKEVYPELDILEEAKPFVKRLMLERYSPERMSADMADLLQSSHALVQALPRRLDRLLQDLEQGRLIVKVEELDPKKSQKARERVAARTAMGIGSGGFAIAGALILATHPITGTLLLLGSAPLLAWTLYSALKPRVK
jgi:ubiquinone biosynthesis protein